MPEIEIELSYEVYRFRKWRKSSLITMIPELSLLVDKKVLIGYLMHIAEKEDQGEIRNLTYKRI